MPGWSMPADLQRRIEGRRKPKRRVVEKAPDSAESSVVDPAPLTAENYVALEVRTPRKGGRNLLPAFNASEWVVVPLDGDDNKENNDGTSGAALSVWHRQEQAARRRELVLRARVATAIKMSSPPSRARRAPGTRLLTLETKLDAAASKKELVVHDRVIRARELARLRTPRKKSRKAGRFLRSRFPWRKEASVREECERRHAGADERRAAQLVSRARRAAQLGNGSFCAQRLRERRQFKLDELTARLERERERERERDGTGGMLERWFGRSKGNRTETRDAASTSTSTSTSSRSQTLSGQRRLQEYHRLAKDLVTRAVTYEENYAYKNAKAHYHKALEIITEALGIDLSSNRTQASDERRLEDLAKWHKSCVERVRHLEQRGKGGQKQKPGAMAKSRAARPNSVSAVSGGTPAKGSAAKKKGDDLREMIEREILDSSPGVSWDDVSGLEKAKQLLREMVILPATRPDIFKGLRAPTRGLLLYGPPGNGKTMLAKATATESTCTFFSVSASTLTSKWVGDSEKLVRVLFEVAAENSPSIVFIDEIDSILSARSANENESSRRLKTEFLIQFDGVSKSDASVFVIGASNRPEELDDAVRRRLAKRIHIPLPDAAGREGALRRLLRGQNIRVSRKEWQWIVDHTEGYSASDIKELCHEAAMMSIRELSPGRLETVAASSVRPMTAEDFRQALLTIKSSVSKDQLDHYERWTREFGTST